MRSAAFAASLCVLAVLAFIGFMGGPVSSCIELGQQLAEASLVAAIAIALLIWLLPIDKVAHLKAVITIMALITAGALAFQPVKMEQFRTDVESCAKQNPQGV